MQKVTKLPLWRRALGLVTRTDSVFPRKAINTPVVGGYKVFAPVWRSKLWPAGCATPGRGAGSRPIRVREHLGLARNVFAPRVAGAEELSSARSVGRDRSCQDVPLRGDGANGVTAIDNQRVADGKPCCIRAEPEHCRRNFLRPS